MKRIILIVGLLSCSFAMADEGQQPIGKLEVALYLGTDDGNVDTGASAVKVNAEKLRALKEVKGLKFNHYFLLGKDSPSVLRSYENWAAPLKPSEAILMSFEPVGKAEGKQIKLDLDLWQSKKKIMKSAATLKLGKPLYIRGPAWRGGYLIIAVELTELK